MDADKEKIWNRRNLYIKKKGRNNEYENKRNEESEEWQIVTISETNILKDGQKKSKQKKEQTI